MIQELGVKIKNVEINHGDLTIGSEDGNTIHIVGDNNWGNIANQILKPYKIKAKGIVALVEQSKNSQRYRGEFVLLGKIEMETMEIAWGGKCDRILGIPVVEVEKENYFMVI